MKTNLNPAIWHLLDKLDRVMRHRSSVSSGLRRYDVRDARACIAAIKILRAAADEVK